MPADNYSAARLAWAQRAGDNATVEELTREFAKEAENAIWIDADDWDEATVPKRRWVVPGLALRRSVTQIVGPPAALKSTIALAFACSVALGKDFSQVCRPLSQEAVIVYNVEDDQDEQRRRLSAILRYFGATPRDVRDRVIRMGPEKVGTLFQRVDGSVTYTPVMQAIIQKIERIRPAILIVDPLAELHTLEENDNTGLRAIFAEFRSLAVEFNLAVIVLHHTKKGFSEAAGDLEAGRGASSMGGAVRISMTLVGMSEKDAAAMGLSTEPEARARYARLDDAKQSYHPIRRAHWFEKQAILLDNDEVVVAAIPWEPPADRTPSLSDLIALATAIERGTPDAQPWSRKLDKNERSVSRLLYAHGFRSKSAKEAVLRRLEADHGLTTAAYTKPDRNPAMGLRIGNKPPAAWKVDPSETHAE